MRALPKNPSGHLWAALSRSLCRASLLWRPQRPLPAAPEVECTMSVTPPFPGRTAGTAAHDFLALVLGTIVWTLVPALPAGALEPGDLDTDFAGDGLVIAPAPIGVATSLPLSAEGRGVALSQGIFFVPDFSAIFGPSRNPSSLRVGFEVNGIGSPNILFNGDADPDPNGLAAQDTNVCRNQYSDAVHKPCGATVICSDSFFVAGNRGLYAGGACDSIPAFTVFEVSSADGLETASYSDKIEDIGAEAFGIARHSPGGDLLAVGTKYSTPSRVALVRLNGDLTLDTSFGSGGQVSHAIGAGDADAYEVALTEDGKAVVVGRTGSETSSKWHPTGSGAFVARFSTSTGEFDASFGNGGVVAWTPAGADAVVASGVQIASDGDVVVSGKYHLPVNCPTPGSCTGGWTGFVQRYDSNGVLDATFGGGDGEVTHSPARFEDVALDSEGRITAVGSVGGDGISPTDTEALLVRYTANGTLDSAFGGGDGVATFPAEAGYDGIRIMSAEMSANSALITIGGTVYSATAGGTDRMFLARVINNGPLCGNNIVELGEDCDLGAGVNGASDNCCTSECLFATLGTQCRAGAGDPNGAGFECDPAETCSGASDACPSDVHHDGLICRTGSGDFCDPNETCPVGPGSVCGPDAIQSAGTECSLADSGDSCDPAEVCDGIATHGCPADVIQPAGTVCRVGSGDVCDPTESCTGVALAPCPADQVAAAGTVCRARADATCDVRETCTGVAAVACPADSFAPLGTICRAAVDICDLTEECSGGICPADLLKPDQDADTVCDEIDNCISIVNLDQADDDTDGVGTACDNCPVTCNPDQGNADSDAGGGDVCDICPAIDESTEDPGCPTAAYNAALPCCRHGASAGVSVDADGPSCGAAADVSFQTPPDPDTGTTVTVEIPSGAVSDPISISVTPMTQGGSDFILSTATGRFVIGAIMEPAGTTFNTPLLICMAWQDADNNGRVDNLSFVVEEDNIRPTLLDEVTGTEVELGPKCSLQGVCGALGPDGLPATVPGTLNDPALAGCCSATDNVYCWEVTHFSAYGIADRSCAGEATARILATRMDKPVGGQGLQVKGEFSLGGPIVGGLDPASSGFGMVIQAADGTPLYEVTLPAGEYSRATGEGWKTSARGGSAQWKSRTGVSGVTQVKLRWADTSGQGSFDLKGKNLSLGVEAGDLPLQAEVRLDPAVPAGRCGVATWTPPGGRCAFTSSGSTLLCQ